MHMLTKRETFDMVKTHMLTQMAVATDGGNCRYRDALGRKCAVGCLVKDEFYNPSMEGCGVVGSGMANASRASLHDALRASGVEVDSPAILHMLSRLQCIHDESPVANWQIRLNALEKEFFGA